MKVNDRNSLGSLEQGSKATETQRIEKEGSSRVAAGKGQGSEDRVELSSVAGRIAGAIHSSAADRSGRVAAVAADYQAGKYQPDSRATSRSMISEALATGMA